jgi:dTDP-4-dehydrorhamnose reductase
MTRVLVLGAAGMLGHKIVQRLRPLLEVTGAVRARDAQTAAFEALTGASILGGLDATIMQTVTRTIETARPDVIVNCVGVVKQREGKTQREELVRVNALFPHELAKACMSSGVRLIHLSTDCVFSGSRGAYAEGDPADPVDSYGMSKLLGEPSGSRVLTLRTSMIGRELRGFHSLVEWFLRQRGEAPGFVNAIFSGLTNIALADEIGRIIQQCPSLEGLYHVSADPINKHELLRRLDAAFGSGLRVVPSDAVSCDRSLVSARYERATGFVAPEWDTMIMQMANDPTPYSQLQALAA